LLRQERDKLPRARVGGDLKNGVYDVGRYLDSSPFKFCALRARAINKPNLWVADTVSAMVRRP
jgi:hypothetical protein